MWAEDYSQHYDHLHSTLYGDVPEWKRLRASSPVVWLREMEATREQRQYILTAAQWFGYDLKE